MFNYHRAPALSGYLAVAYVSFVVAVAAALLSVAFTMPLLAQAQVTPPAAESPVITPSIPEASVTVVPVANTTESAAFAGISRDGWIALGIVAVAVLLIVVGWGMGGTNSATTAVHRTNTI